jgi:hypothetical protein
MNTAEITAAELAAGMTALRERFTLPNGRTVIAALSANNRWGYEKESGQWTVIERLAARGGHGDRPTLHFARSLKAARQLTFELDHPLHAVPREPKPARWSVA